MCVPPWHHHRPPPAPQKTQKTLQKKQKKETPETFQKRKKKKRQNTRPCCCGCGCSCFPASLSLSVSASSLSLSLPLVVSFALLSSPSFRSPPPPSSFLSVPRPSSGSWFPGQLSLPPVVAPTLGRVFFILRSPRRLFVSDLFFCSAQTLSTCYCFQLSPRAMEPSLRGTVVWRFVSFPPRERVRLPDTPRADFLKEARTSVTKHGHPLMVTSPSW